MDNKKLQTKLTYDRSAESLVKKFNSIGARVSDIQRTFSCIQKENPKVIEIGCGNGRDAEEILKYTSDYLGFDISSELIRWVSPSLPKEKFIVADVEEFIWPENVDIVFSFASLLHTPKEALQKILTDIYQSLSRDGVFFLSLKCDVYQEKEQVDEFGTRTFYYYLPEDIERMLEGKMKNIYLDFQEIKGQKWFTILLQNLLSHESNNKVERSKKN